jgi:hypothetical protein
MNALLDSVVVHSFGDSLVFSSEDEYSLREVVQEFAKRGGSLVREPTRVGEEWLATMASPHKR